MAYRHIPPGEDVARPRVVEWVPALIKPIALGYVVDAALLGVVAQNDAGLVGLLTTDVGEVLDMEVTPTNQAAFRSVEKAAQGLDIVARVLGTF